MQAEFHELPGSTGKVTHISTCTDSDSQSVYDGYRTGTHSTCRLIRS